MTDALRFEWTRIRTVRSSYWLTGLAVLLSAVVAGLFAYFNREDGLDDGLAGVVLTGGTQFVPLPFVPLFMGIIGAFTFGHEYRHNLILPTLTAVPRRRDLMAAKITVLVLWSLATAVVSVALNWGLGSLLTGENVPLVADPVGPAVLAYIGYVVLWGLLGLGLGALIRNLPAVLVVLLLVPLIVEPTISAFITFIDALEGLRPAIPYLPFTAGTAMSSTYDLSQLNGGGPELGDTPARWVSAVTITAWIAAVVAPAWALFHRRDA